MYPVRPHQTITDEQCESLVEHGYLILPELIRGEELAMLQAAQRRVLKPWEEFQKEPVPSDGGEHTMFVKYPPRDVTMAAFYRHPTLLDLGRRFLKTQAVVFRVGYMLARYPGFVSGDTGHIDNANNSLLPMSETAREYGQIGFWIHLEEVTENDAPLLLCSNKRGRDISLAEPLICPAGSIAIFTNYTWHASSSFKGASGQRFVWGFGLGAAANEFEGFVHYTMHGTDPVFQQVIGECTAEERCLFRFPPPGHPYYTPQTLAALEKQYPGWNSRGEY